MIFSEQPEPRLAQCVECGRISGPYWMRWRALRIEEPESGEEPQLALYCAACAESEFGPPRRRPLDERRKQHRN